MEEDNIAEIITDAFYHHEFARRNPMQADQVVVLEEKLNYDFHKITGDRISDIYTTEHTNKTLMKICVDIINYFSILNTSVSKKAA